MRVCQVARTPGLVLGQSIVTPGVFPLPDTASCPGGPGAGPAPGVPLGQGYDCTIDFQVFIPDTAVAIPPNVEFPVQLSIPYIPKGPPPTE